MTESVTQRAVSNRMARLLLPAILLFTAISILAWGHYKLLDQDERFVLQTGSVPTVRALVDVQRRSPISLDPLFYHLLSHAAVKIFGNAAFAIRLPSVAGYLLMQVCLFGVGRIVGGARAGLIAAIVPACTATLYYGVEARPYGVLLGLSAAMLLSWMQAARINRGRAPWLLLLAVSLALALNTHYFAVLLLLPLCGAEMARTLRRQRVDGPMLLSLAAGAAGVATTLPFQRAAGEFRLHYYNAGAVGLHAITQSYRTLVINYTDYSMRVQHACMILLALLAMLLLLALWRALQPPSATIAREAEVYLLLLASLPFAGFLVARFVTHSIEVRYVLPAIVAIAVLVPLALQPQRWSGRTFGAFVAVSLLVCATAGGERVREERARTGIRLAALTLPAAVRDHLLATPGARLYVQNLGDFEENTPYLADPAIRDRVTLLYSAQEELRWLHHDTAALTATHLQRFAHVPVLRYEELRRLPGEQLILVRYGGGWNWIGDALQQDRARIVPVADALGGTIAAVQFVESRK